MIVDTIPAFAYVLMTGKQACFVSGTALLVLCPSQPTSILVYL